LDLLAQKLGTTAEHLWGILVKQAGVSVISDAVVCCMLIVFLAVFWFIAERWLNHLEGNESNNDEIDRFFSVFVIANIASLFAFGFLLYAIATATTRLLNPEYWALQEILKVFK
jgi:hypothetical protein